MFCCPAKDEYPPVMHMLVYHERSMEHVQHQYFKFSNRSDYRKMCFFLVHRYCKVPRAYLSVPSGLLLILQVFSNLADILQNMYDRLPSSVYFGKDQKCNARTGVKTCHLCLCFFVYPWCYRMLNLCV